MAPRLLKTSSMFNLRPSAPGQATSSVWVSEKAGEDSRPSPQCFILWGRRLSFKAQFFQWTG